MVLVTKSDFLWDVVSCGVVDRYQLFGGHAATIFSTVILRWKWKQYVTPKYFNNLKSYTMPQNTQKIILCNQSKNVRNIKSLMLVVVVVVKLVRMVVLVVVLVMINMMLVMEVVMIMAVAALVILVVAMVIITI